jgi:hypothetical protein
MKSRIAMAKAAFKKTKAFLTIKEETNEMLHLQHGFVWC